MSLDRPSLDAVVSEIAARVVGRRIEKVRPHGKWALRVELSSRETLFLDVSRAVAGVWLLTRDEAVPHDPREVEGPSRTATLLFKKHLEGSRIEELSSTPDRILTVRTSRAEVLLRPWGAPAATLVLDGKAIAHFGAGEQVTRDPTPPRTPLPTQLDPTQPGFPSPAPAPAPDPLTSLRGASPLGTATKQPPPPTTNPAPPPPTTNPEPPPAKPFLSPPPGDDATNAASPPRLVPFEPPEPALPFPSFATAAARLYILHRRADLFRERAQSNLSRAKTELARLTRLKAALERDRGRWPNPSDLRHHAEALLAASPDHAPAISGGRDVVALSIPDPRTGEAIEVRIQPRLTLPQNANALYERARNLERRKDAFEARWTAMMSDLEAAERALEGAKALRSLDELDAPVSEKGPDPRGGGGRKRYLTSRGLEILFGRSAAENHDVTFKLAKREDLWLHVLDAPGGHVVLRNSQGRATREDIAEAASLAAFLSERRTEANVDVQYTERKHVQPAGGGKGRVKVAHAEVIRVTPLDPAGRLRAR